MNFIKDKIHVENLLMRDGNRQGNKDFKLYYNLEEAKRQDKSQILTFGGAYSNHILATADLGKKHGFKTIGIIRGNELAADLDNTFSKNPTLKKAKEQGMQFDFISRSEYRQKDTPEFLDKLRQQFPKAYIIPEGGTNNLAIKGCKAILTEAHSTYDYICCPVGTGGTISGIIEASKSHQTVLGFPALKGDFLSEEIKKYTKRTNWTLITDYHFEGYAKVTSELIQFINSYKAEHGVQLDPIYTGKLFFGLQDLIKNGYFHENSRILAIHTGGLQGIAGMNVKLKQKGLPLIDVST